MANTTDIGSPSVGPDSLFDALADAHRRRVLAALLDRPMRTTGDLARTLAAADGRRTDRRPSETHTDAVEHHRLQLRHAHLPRLADLGLIDYDFDRDTVELTAPQTSRKVIEAITDSVEQ